MRIVLIGDLHFYALGVWPWELIGKRFWGQMNLWINRRRTFKPQRMGAVIDRVHEINPDLLLFSGDLTTTALEREFAMAALALGPLLRRRPAVMVPGNHDRHSFHSARRKLLEGAFPEQVPASFPFHRPLGNDLHLIALDPTRPNIITDRGRVGPRQLGALAGLLASLPEAARVMVLCHYTLGMPEGLHRESSRHRLIDEQELREVLARGGRETLYLHGHVHSPFCWRVPGALNVIAVNAGAPLLHQGRWPAGQGIWEIRDDRPWTLMHHTQDMQGSWRVEPGAVR